MGSQILDRDRRAGRGKPHRLALPEVAVVEGVEPLGSKHGQRRREGRQADPLAGSPCASACPKHSVEPVTARRLPGDRCHRLDIADELVRRGEPGTGQLDRRRQDDVARQPPEAGVRIAP